MPLYRASFFEWFLRLFVASCLFRSSIALAQFNTANWPSIDHHALAAPAHLESDLKKLGAYLGQPFADQPSKLRAVYRWITDRMQYDTDSFRSGKQKNQTAQQALSSKIATCDGFSNLFEELAKHAGVPVVTVIGFAKDALHQKGEGFTETNHAWNLAQINGRWWLIDSTWGAGFDDGVRFVKRFDPHYFLVPPEDLVLTHFARDTHLRVGHHSADITDFRQLPYAPVTLLSLTKLGLPDIHRAKSEGFAQTYDIPRGSLTLRKGHLHKDLASRQLYAWELESNVFHQFAVIQNGNWTYFTRSPDGIFSASLMPTGPGNVQLGAKRANETEYTIFMEYLIR